MSPANDTPTDQHGRPLRSLRISVTDRCNLRCTYCMPEPDYVWLPREDLLTFEEIARLIDAFVLLGVRQVRITGGEPLLRRDLADLVRLVAARPGIDEIAMTTNGVELAARIEELARAGLDRVTVSLDTLDAERFASLTGRDRLASVKRGLEALGASSLVNGKLNTVVVRNFNDDELVEVLRFGTEHGLEVRFIEYMDVGGATQWSSDRVVGRAEILERIQNGLGPARPLPALDAAPARRFALPDGTRFGIIASTTEPFCDSCDRGRLTADGTWLQCLYADRGLDLRSLVRSGADTEAIHAALKHAWTRRDARGALERLAIARRGPLVPLQRLRDNPHLEMHTRGG